MIYGIGTDIIEVSRVQKMMEKTPGLREALFTPDEIIYCESKQNKYLHYAARFCAKESFLKALGTGLVGEMNFREIEVLHTPLGKPNIKLSGAIEAYFRNDNLSQIYLSIAHIRNTAIAFVIVEKE